MALLITFEGGEGCGKTLQSRILYRRMIQNSCPAILIHEPGGTLLGQRVRYLLKQSCQIPISPVVELLLFNASRGQLVQDVIRPALKGDKTVICDRFSDSTLAYQSYGRGLDADKVREVNEMAVAGLKPDVTFLLDIRPEIGLSRKKSGINDRYEQEKLDFHRRVRDGFLELASQDPGRWIIINSELSRKHISELIWQKVSDLFKLVYPIPLT